MLKVKVVLVGKGKKLHYQVDKYALNYTLCGLGEPVKMKVTNKNQAIEYCKKCQNGVMDLKIELKAELQFIDN